MATVFNQRALDDAREESLRLKTEVTELEKQNKQVPAEIHEIEAKLTDLENQKKSLRNQLSKKNTDLTRVRSAYPEAKRKLESITKDQEELSRTLKEQQKAA